MGFKDEFKRYFPERRKRCAAIIHTASAAAAGAAGATMVPGSDSIAIAPVQVAMVTALADEFDVPWTDAAVRSTLYATLGTMVGKGGANLVLRWVPVWGNVVRAGVAAGVTQALGWAVVKKLETEGKLI